jgi:transposase
MAFKEQSAKLSLLAKENKKTTLYKDTVKKQESVIGKLEGLLEKLMRDKKARDAERKALNNAQAENDAKFMTSEEEKLRIQISKQEEIINDLRDDLANIKGGN